MPRRGKPRYLGLILTGILLVLLVLVGAWSTLFLASNDATTDAPAPATAVAAGEVPTIEDEAAADLAAEGEAEAPPTSDDLAAAPAQGEAPLSDPAPEGATEVAASAAPLTLGGGTDEILLSAADPAPAPPDPSVLALVDARSDALPAPALPPPAFGTAFQFDADGLIVPTPEGIATPEGVLLVAGRPAVIPASRPASVLAAAAAAAPAGTAPEAGTAGTGALTAPGSTVPLGDATTPPSEADPAATSAPAPRARPAALVPAPEDSGTLAVPTGVQIAATGRPRLRPATPPPQSASLVSDGAVLDGIGAPAARPEDVEQAVAAALAAAEAPADAATPEADAEPEDGGGQIPSSASVAREATVKNAINLSKLTLIGIFGTESNRHALVRQPNGRLVKVEVGDRLDGGKVVAITTTEVRVQKGGEVISLTLPKT
jgi:type IV pilus biogenesis protein PilP